MIQCLESRASQFDWLVSILCQVSTTCWSWVPAPPGSRLRWKLRVAVCTWSCWNLCESQPEPPLVPTPSVSGCLGFLQFLHLFNTEVCSRMRSEGFPFIVGVWGWTCVRLVLVVSSWCRRRRRGVGASLISLHWAVHSKVEEVSHDMLVLALPSHKIAFCVTGAIPWKRVNASASFFRGRRSTLRCGLSRCRGRRSIF